MFIQILTVLSKIDYKFLTSESILILNCSLGLECPILHNPADFFLSKLNSGPEPTAEICCRFNESSIGKALEMELANIRDDSNQNNFIYGVSQKLYSKIVNFDTRIYHLHSM